MYTEADSKGRQTRLTTHLRCGIVVYPTDIAATASSLSSSGRSSVVTRTALTASVESLPDRLLSLFDVPNTLAPGGAEATRHGHGPSGNGSAWASLPGGAGMLRWSRDWSEHWNCTRNM